MKIIPLMVALALVYLMARGAGKRYEEYLKNDN